MGGTSAKDIRISELESELSCANCKLFSLLVIIIGFSVTFGRDFMNQYQKSSHDLKIEKESNHMWVNNLEECKTKLERYKSEAILHEEHLKILKADFKRYTEYIKELQDLAENLHNKNTKLNVCEFIPGYDEQQESVIDVSKVKIIKEDLENRIKYLEEESNYYRKVLDKIDNLLESS